MRIQQFFVASVVFLTIGITACGPMEKEEISPDSTRHAASSQEGLTGLSCAKGAEDDGKMCAAVYAVTCSSEQFAACYKQAYAACLPRYNAAIAQCNLGIVQVHRTVGGFSLGGLHRESMVQELGSTIESTFKFSATPVLGAESRPIYRCLISNVREGDFPTFDANCEGKGSAQALSFHGYSYKSTTPGAYPVYRCRTGSDHFLSRDSNCEGKVQEKGALTAYAK